MIMKLYQFQHSNKNVIKMSVTTYPKGSWSLKVQHTYLVST